MYNKYDESISPASLMKYDSIVVNFEDFLDYSELMRLNTSLHLGGSRKIEFCI